MKKKNLLLFFLVIFHEVGLTQIDLQNYSTSFDGSPKDGKTPILITAVPYNGNYFSEIDHVFSRAPGGDSTDLSHPNSTDRLKSFRQLNTFDSSEIYFFGAGIHPSNAALYEFRVLLNGGKEMQPWTGITRFTGEDVQLNEFKKQFAFLGGFRTNWGNYLIADLRKKGTESILSRSIVYWMPTRPSLLNIYTSDELKEFLKKESKPYDLYLNPGELKKWKERYPSDQLDSLTGLPKKLILAPREDNVIFYIKAGVFKKEALEYQVIRNGTVYLAWRANDFDNNFIWLKNLPPGGYVLQMRFSAQRHNQADYPFEHRAAWNQTLLFKLLAGFLVAATLGAILLLFKLTRQRRRMKLEASKKEKLTLELKSIRSQLNPHFIFNALSSIQGLINKNEIAAANRYLSEFGSLLRDSLAGSDKDLTDLATEIKVLETYLGLEQLRFGFQYNVEVAGDINPYETEIPCFLLQPLVENAVKHGLSAHPGEGLVQIRFLKENANFIVLIQDNGNGFPEEKDVQENVGGQRDARGQGDHGHGYGLRLTRDRIKLLNELGRSITFSIAGAPGKGTIVRFNFSNWW